MTITQLQTFSNTKPELRYLTEQIIDYLEANPIGGPGSPAFTGTPGSVLFVKADGTIGEDNTHFYYNGIGSLLLGAQVAVQSSAKLEVHASANNSGGGVYISNDGGGNDAFAYITLAGALFNKYGPLYATSGGHAADSLVIENPDSGGVNLIASHASGSVHLYAGGNTSNDLKAAITNNENLVLYHGNGANAAIHVQHSYNAGNQVLFWIDPPVVFNVDAANKSVPYTWRLLPVDNGDGTTNTVMQWGFNIGQLAVPGVRGTWYATESNYSTGGTHYVENHLIYQNAGGENSRIYSSTLIEGANLAASRNQWDFRGETFVISSLDNTTYFTASLNKSNSNATLLVQSNGGLAMLSLNDGTFSANLYNTSQALTLDNVGLKLNGKEANGYQLVLNNTSASSNCQMAWFRNNGSAFSITLEGSSHGGSLANMYYWYDSAGSHIPARFTPNGRVIIADDAVGVADSGAMLKVAGSISTANPGGGIDEWLLGQFKAGVVALDTANYVEVKIGATVRKLLCST